MVDLAAEGKYEEAIKFFETEYKLDHLIGNLEKPYVSIMDGITSKYNYIIKSIIFNISYV